MADSEQQLGITVIAEVQSAIDDLQDLFNAITELPEDKISTIQIETENGEDIETLKTELDDLDNKDVNVTANVDGDATTDITSIKDDVDEIDNKDITMEANLTGDAETGLNDINTDVEDVNGKEVDIDTNVTGDGLEDIETIKEDADSLNGSEVDIDIDDTGDAEGDLEDVSDNTDSSGGSSSGLSNVVGAATGAAVYGAATGAQDYNLNIEQSVAFTHATEAQTEAMKKAIQVNSTAENPVDELSGAYLSLAGSYGDATEATAYFNAEMPFVTANNLDAASTIPSLTSLMRAFGVSSGDAGDTLGELTYDAATANVPVSSMLSSMTRLAPALNSVNFSLKDAGALMAALGESGVSGTRGLSAIKSGISTFDKDFSTSNANLATYQQSLQAIGVADYSDTNDPSKVFKEALVALGKMPDSTQKTQDAIAIFGSGAGLVLGQLKSNYQDVETQANKTGQSIQDKNKESADQAQHSLGIVSNAVQTLGTYLSGGEAAVAGFFAAIGTGGEMLLAGAGFIGYEAYQEKVNKWVTGVGDGIVDGFRAQTPKVLNEGRALQEEFYEIFRKPDTDNPIGEWFKQFDSPKNVSAIDEAFGRIVTVVKSGISKIDLIFNDPTSYIGRFDQAKLSTYLGKNISDSIEESESSISSSVKGLYSHISDFLSEEEGSIRIPNLSNIGEDIPKTLEDGINIKLPSLKEYGCFNS